MKFVNWLRPLMAGLVVLGVAIACSSGIGEASNDRASFEDSVSREYLAIESAREEALFDCAIFNGVDLDEARDWLDFAVFSYNETVGESAIEEREAFAERGSGLIHGARELQIQDEARSRSEEPSQVVRDVMRVGPVIDPVTDERFEGGCDTWVDETFIESPDSAALFSSEAAWHQYVGDFLAGSGELSDLDSAWSKCMANQGFEDMRQLGDQLGLIFPLATQYEAGELDFEEALERDIEISLTSFDCMTEIDYQGRREHLVDEAWHEFNS